MPHDDDEDWRAIVDNFGERAVLGPDDLPPAEEPPEQPAPAPEPPGPDPDDRFVPPEPPPVEMPPTDRLLAWAGVIGSPLVLLVAVMARIDLPTWFGWLLVGGFIGGFGYLVAQMRTEPRDPWDDGSRL